MEYQEGKIYKIFNLDMPEELPYFGSTIQTLGDRYSQHNNNIYNKTSSKKLFEYGRPKIVCVENFPCNSKKELEVRERYYIENFDCINQVIPGRTKKEYREVNKDKLQKQQKEWKDNNKEKKAEYDKIYREDNRKILCEKQKIYSSKNKEKLAEYQKQWYETNKEKINNYSKEKITCECGRSVRQNGLSEHKRSKIHNKLMNDM
tara:strand:+ start:681 stop:1292 length:612 start_codon:yes stop_codon:yes gene_type:complete